MEVQAGSLGRCTLNEWKLPWVELSNMTVGRNALWYSQQEGRGLLSFVVLLCAVGAISGGGKLLHETYPQYAGVPFRGELCVAHQNAERTAVHPSGRASDFQAGQTPVYRETPASAIRFTNPGVVVPRLEEGRLYDVVRLPFLVALENYAIEEQPSPQRFLEIRGPEGRGRIAISQGDRLALNGKEGEVTAVQRWSGLIRDSRGQTMAAISLREGDTSWSDRIFLTEGAWSTMEPDTGLYLDWKANEEAAAEQARSPLPDLDDARWGAVEGSVVHWFGSFLPGSGVTLSDGSIVTLLAYEERHGEREAPAVLVEVEEGDARTREWYYANDYSHGDAVRFEYPGKLPRAIALYPWRQGAAQAAAYRQGEVVDSQRLEEGATWRVDEFDLEVRLDQVMEDAVPVHQRESPFTEAIIELEEETLQLREGEAVRMEELLLEFSTQTPPPVMRYDLRIVNPEDDVDMTAELRAGEEVRAGSWVIRQGAVDPLALDKALLEVEYARDPTPLWIGGGLVAGGLTPFFGLALGSWKRRRRKSKSSSAG